MTAPRIWFPFYAADFLSDSKVAALSDSQERHLVRLWCFYWRDGPLPDDLDALCRMLGGACSTDVERVLQRFFNRNPDTGLWHSARMDAEKRAATTNKKQKILAGKASAKARATKELEQPLNGRSTPVQQKVNPSPSPSPTPYCRDETKGALFADPGAQMQYDAYLVAARFPDSVRAAVRAVAEGMPGHGPGYGWPVVGKALIELAAAGSTFSEQGLRAFARTVKSRPAETVPPTNVTDDLGRSVPCREADGWWVSLASGERVAEVRHAG